MKFDIRPNATVPPHTVSDELLIIQATKRIEHLESIVKAQDELLKKAIEYCQWQDTYDALQQAIKEAQS